MVEKTNIHLEGKGARRTAAGEVMKFFGILILMNRIEFLNRRDLWCKQPFSRFRPEPNIGNAMSRNSFELIRSSLRFSGNGVTEEQGYARWDFVTDFVQATNDHRRSYVTHMTPSEALCIEERISRWYGLGGHLIDVGLPHYTALDRKPENALEMKTVCYGRSGTMLNIELEMGSKFPQQDFGADNSHGTAVLLRLVQRCFGSERVVCADSFFASVNTAKSILEKGLRFIGAIKNATREYPMRYLSQYTLPNRKDFVSMVSKENVINTDIMAILWVDRERGHFVSTCATVNACKLIVRERWRREGNVSKKFELEVPIPKFVENTTKYVQ